jgi:hypothetical protein
MTAERDAVEWLRMMAQYSPLTDCKPHFTRIADELEALRAEKAALHEALVAGHRLAA